MLVTNQICLVILSLDRNIDIPEKMNKNIGYKSIVYKNLYIISPNFFRYNDSIIDSQKSMAYSILSFVHKRLFYTSLSFLFQLLGLATLGYGIWILVSTGNTSHFLKGTLVSRQYLSKGTHNSFGIKFLAFVIFFFFFFVDDTFMKSTKKNIWSWWKHFHVWAWADPVLRKRRIIQMRAPVFVFVPSSKYLAYSCSCSFSRVIYEICIGHCVFFMPASVNIQLCSILWSLDPFVTCGRSLTWFWHLLLFSALSDFFGWIC